MEAGPRYLEGTTVGSGRDIIGVRRDRIADIISTGREIISRAKSEKILPDTITGATAALLVTIAGWLYLFVSTGKVAIGFAKTIELAKYVVTLVRRNPDSRIPHLDPQLRAAPPAADHDPPARRIAHRVGHQVEQDSLEQNEVRAHPSAARDHLQRQFLFPRRFGKS